MTAAFKASVRALQILGRARLDDVIGTRWALLQTAGLNVLRQLHPRCINDELIDNDINWSAVLDLSATGLRKIPEIALYADAWAEEAARRPESFKSFASWYGFLGTPEQLILDDLIRNGILSVRTSKNTIMCSYQLHCELMDCTCAAEFNAALRAAGCSFKPLTNQFYLELIGRFENFNAA